MDWRLEDIRLFVEVVRSGSFTAAAERLSVPRSSVSRRIGDLERTTGVRLLWRTTRAMRTTDVGAKFFEQCRLALDSIDEAERVLLDASDAPRGRLRITAPPGLGPRMLSGPLARYMAEHPSVTVDLHLTDAVVDIRAEGFDLGLRVGPVVDEALVAREIGKLHIGLFATPDYLEARGVPTAPGDLETHDLLVFGRCPDAVVMRLSKGDETSTLEVDARMSSNDFDALTAATLAGCGIGMLTTQLAEPSVRSGALVEILERWRLTPAPIHLVYLGGALRSQKLRAFLELIGGPGTARDERR